MSDLRFVLPQQNKAALFRDVTYNIPGLFMYSDLIFCLLDLVEEKFNYKIPIKFMYGAPQTMWNGGRLILNKYKNDFSLKGIEKELVTIIEKNIVPLLTFSNISLQEKDLSDKYCNELLTLMNEIGGGVIVASELLAKYIKEMYPKISLHTSVITTAFENNRSEQYYQLISDRTDYYVIHPDDNFNIDLLVGLPKENAEIIINERCFYNCSQRRNHYKSISQDQRLQINNQNKYSKFLDICNAIPEMKQGSSRQNNITLSIDEVSKIIDLGYSSLKIQGRTDSLYTFFFDLLRYTLEPKVAFPHMYTIFIYYIEQYLKEV